MDSPKFTEAKALIKDLDCYFPRWDDGKDRVVVTVEIKVELYDKVINIFKKANWILIEDTVGTNGGTLKFASTELDVLQVNNKKLVCIVCTVILLTTGIFVYVFDSAFILIYAPLALYAAFFMFFSNKIDKNEIQFRDARTLQRLVRVPYSKIKKIEIINHIIQNTKWGLPVLHLLLNDGTKKIIAPAVHSKIELQLYFKKWIDVEVETRDTSEKIPRQNQFIHFICLWIFYYLIKHFFTG